VQKGASNKVGKGKAIATAVLTPVLSESVARFCCWAPIESVKPRKLGVILAGESIYGAGAKAGRDKSENLLGKAEVVGISDF
jgi:hypothetical protein